MSAAALVAMLRRRYGPPADDTDLLAAYAQRHDDDAFRRLVARHGPLVLRLCRRLLGDGPDAEDAFQAVFLTLARRAGSVRRPQALTAWLYGVARRVCRNARTARDRRRVAEAQATPRATPEPAAELSARELLAVLDEELDRLPERQRLPLALVYWQGLPHVEAARRLGLTPGALHGRLERGRARLAERLTRRGFAPSAVLVAPLAATAVPRDLLAATVALAAEPWAKSLPTAVLALAAAGTSAKMASGVALGALLLAGVGMVTLAGGESPAKPQAANTPALVSPRESQPDAPRVDRFGDPLPAGALVRLGTLRYRGAGFIGNLNLLPDRRLVASLGDDGIRAEFRPL